MSLNAAYEEFVRILQTPYAAAPSPVWLSGTSEDGLTRVCVLFLWNGALVRLNWEQYGWTPAMAEVARGLVGNWPMATAMQWPGMSQPYCDGVYDPWQIAMDGGA